MENKLKIEVLDKDCIGYSEFFKWLNCNDANLTSSYNFCPNCGCELEFNLVEAFSRKEEVIINIGKLKGVCAEFYDFDRRTGKVTVKVDGNELTFDYKDIIRKNKC